MWRQESAHLMSLMMRQAYLSCAFSSETVPIGVGRRRVIEGTAAARKSEAGAGSSMEEEGWPQPDRGGNKTGGRDWGIGDQSSQDSGSQWYEANARAEPVDKSQTRPGA